jgi:hypothetical protein
MIMRQHVEGIKKEGLHVTTEGMKMFISPGVFEIPPHDKAIIEDEVVLDFSSIKKTCDVVIGFDMFGRMYVDCHIRGEESSAEDLPRMTHYVYFTIEEGMRDLNNTIINVLYPSI